MKHYILVDRIAVECPDLLAWGRWMGGDHKMRVVQQDHVGDELVSTVFLGLDHNYTQDGPPLLFETLVFYSNGEQGEMYRYSTWGQAHAGHQVVLAEVKRQAAIAEMEATGQLDAIMQKE